MPRFINLIGIAFLGFILAASVTAQQQDQSQYDHGTPPQHAAGISEIGSYLSTDLGTVNLSNGSLNLKLPLGSIGGRGFELPLVLNYSSKIWSATLSTDFDPDRPAPGQNEPVAWAVYDDPNAAVDLYQRVTAGWTIGAVPMLRVRGLGSYNTNNPNCGGTTDYLWVLVKLTVILPDKGEIELRDDQTDGAPTGGVVGSNGCRNMSGYRGKRWHATDGSGTILSATWIMQSLMGI